MITAPEEYLTTAEFGRRLRWSARTIHGKIAAGIFREGVHFFEPPGCHRLWKWESVVAWLEGKDRAVVNGGARDEPSRLARGDPADAGSKERQE